MSFRFRKKEPSRKFKYVMLTLICIFYFGVYGYCGASISTLFTTISPQLGWSTMQTSAIWGAVPLGMTCFTLISGILLDKLSTKLLMGISICIAVVAIFGRGITEDFPSFYMFMFMVGISQAISFPGNVKVITTWFEREQLFRANGILLSVGHMGMLVGYNCTFLFSVAVGGWHVMYRILGVMILVFAILWFVVARDKRDEDVALNRQLKANIEKVSIWQNLKLILSTRDAWFIFIAEFILIGSIQTYMGFAPTVFLEVEGATPQLAAATASMGSLGSMIGYAVLPMISDKFGRKKPFVWPSMIASVILRVWALQSGNLTMAGAVLFFGALMDGWAITGPRTMLQELPQIAGIRSGTALGILNTFSRAAAAGFPMIYALISDAVGSHRNALSVLFSFLIISAIMMSLVRETGTKARIKKEQRTT